MASVPRPTVAWTPPPARVNGERLLAARAAEQRAAAALAEAKKLNAEAKQEDLSVKEEVRNLKAQLAELKQDLPKIIPGGGGKRTIAKVLERDFKIGPRLTPELYGAKGNGTADDSAAFAALLAAHSRKKSEIFIGNGKRYLVNAALTSNEDWIRIVGDGTGTIVRTSTSGTILTIGSGRAAISTKMLTANLRFGSKILTLDSTTGIQAGDIALLQSTKAWYNDPRNHANVSAGEYGAVVSSTTTSAVLAAGLTTTGSIIGAPITFLAGAAAGFSRTILTYNDTTKEVTFAALPAAPTVGTNYRIPQAFKGQTFRVGRVIDATTIEVEAPSADGYHVQDSTAANIKESVTVTIYRPYRPVIKGVKFEGPASASEATGLWLYNASDMDIDIECINLRNAGGRATRCVGGDWNITARGTSDTQTGYGSQISLCANVSVSGRGWNNRRILDVSGITPSDNIRLHSFYAFGGGVDETGVGYHPLGAIANTCLGTHGPARGTIYENNYLAGAYYGIYERGRGAIVRNNTFGPYIKYPVYHSHGGPLAFYGNRVDPLGYNDVVTSDELVEMAGFGGDVTEAYAECLVVLGANLLSSQPESSIRVFNNIGRVRQNIVQLHHSSGGSTLSPSNLNVYDNDVEFYPASLTDVIATFGKMAGSDSGGVALNGGRYGFNRMRTPSGGQWPVVCGTGVSMGTTAPYQELGPNVFRAQIHNGQIVQIPVPQSVSNRLRVAIMAEQNSEVVDGFISKNSATTGGMASTGFEFLTAAPAAGGGTDGQAQVHFGDGVLTIGNRRGGTRTFVITVSPTV